MPRRLPGSIVPEPSSTGSNLSSAGRSKNLNSSSSTGRSSRSSPGLLGDSDDSPLADLAAEALIYGFRIQDTPDMGRVCVSQRNFDVGTVIFHERSLVCASDRLSRCYMCGTASGSEHPPGCAKAMRRFGLNEKLMSELDQKCASISQYEGFNTIDRARVWSKCMIMSQRGLAHSLAPLAELTAANLARCRASVEKVHDLHPDLLPADMSIEEAARILAVLNTNSHQLEELDGSGLFLMACLVQHNCNPNCSFTTHGDHLWLTAIKPIALGDRLSIDYGNNYYSPVLERVSDLRATYEFECKCASCTSMPDKARCFKCPKVNCEGKVCPIGLGDGYWVCLDCQHRCTPQQIERFKSQEAEFGVALEQRGVAGLDELDELLAEVDVVHPHHFMVFWILSDLAKICAGNISACKEGHAETVLMRVIEALNHTVPTYHHEKVVFLDSLAQTRVVAENIAGAREAWQAAYEMSVKVSGVNTLPTLAIRNLVTDTPCSIQEMVARYNANNTVTGGVDEMIVDPEVG